MTNALFKTWFGVAIAVFIFMLFHTSTPANFLGRYSISYAVLLGSVALTAGIAGVGAWKTRVHALTLPPLSPRISWAIVALIGVAIVLFWLFVPVTNFVPAPALFRVYVVGILAMCAILFIQHTPPLQLSSQHHLLIGVMVLAVAVGATALFLGNSPPALYYDEGIIGSWSSAFFRTGDPRNFGIFIDLPSNSAQFGLYPLGAWLDLFGIGYVQARAWALTMGVLALPFVVLLMRGSVQNGGLWLACGVSFLAFFSQAYIRTDALVAPLLAIALWGYSRAKGRFWAYFGVGFVLALTIEAHQLGLRFAIAFGAWETIAYLRSVWRTRQWRYVPFWGILLGGIAYGGVYLLWHLALFRVSLGEFIRLTQEAYYVETLIGGSLPFTERIVQHVVSFITHHLINTPQEGFIIVGATVLALWQKQSSLRFWVVIFWLSVGAYMWLNPKPNNIDYYMVHHAPLLLVMLIYGLAWLSTRFHVGVAVATGVLLLVWSGAILSQNAKNNEIRELIDVGYQVDAFLPEEAQGVIAWESLYWGLAERGVYSTRSFAKREVLELVQARNLRVPDVVIVTYGLDDTQQSVQNYIIQEQLERVACYPIRAFNGRVEVFIRPEIRITQKKEC